VKLTEHETKGMKKSIDMNNLTNLKCFQSFSENRYQIGNGFVSFPEKTIENVKTKMILVCIRG